MKLFKWIINFKNKHISHKNCESSKWVPTHGESNKTNFEEEIILHCDKCDTKIIRYTIPIRNNPL